MSGLLSIYIGPVQIDIGHGQGWAAQGFGWAGCYVSLGYVSLALWAPRVVRSWRRLGYRKWASLNS